MVTEQERLQKIGLLPILNPTGDPFSDMKNVKIPQDKESLKKLQVKVNLKKMDEAPRAYSQLLKEAEKLNKSPQKKLRAQNEKGSRLCDRFEGIQNAKAAIHPRLIQLINEKRGITG